MHPVYDMYDKLIEVGVTSGRKFTADTKPSQLIDRQTAHSRYCRK